jgi:hypothetical protein
VSVPKGLGRGRTPVMALDLVLIPKVGVMGGAIASCVAYVTSTTVLLLCLRSVTRSYGAAAENPRLSHRPGIAEALAERARALETRR